MEIRQAGFSEIKKEVEMKKKILAVALCVCTIFSMSSCGKEQKSKTTEGKLTLGEYKGYTVEESEAAVSEEDVERYITSILRSYQTTENVTEGTTAEEDVINVTYHRTVNGEEYTDSQTVKNDDGSVAGNTENVTLKADSYAIAGFTDGLIGKAVGETVEMDLKFPDDYNDEEVAGQDVHYSVLINHIRVTVIPEFTDDFVSEHYAFAGFTSADTFREFIKKEIYYINVNSAIWDEILEAQTVESYPTDEVQSYVDRMMAQYTNYVSAYGYSLDAYYQALGQTEEEFKKEIEDACKEVVKEKMFIRAVAEKEGIKYNDEAAAEYAAISGYNSVEEFSQRLEDGGEELDYMVVSYLVQNFICENATIVPDSETTAPEAASGEASGDETTDGAQTNSPEDETTDEAQTNSPEDETTNETPENQE